MLVMDKHKSRAYNKCITHRGATLMSKEIEAYNQLTNDSQRLGYVLSLMERIASETGKMMDGAALTETGKHFLALDVENAKEIASKCLTTR